METQGEYSANSVDVEMISSRKDEETRLDVIDRKTIKSIWSSRNVNWVELEAARTSGGILIMWKEDMIEVRDSVIGVFSIFILRRFCGWSEGWITGVYGQCNLRERKNFWQELNDLASLCSE